MADANVVVQKAISDLTNAVQGATSEISTLAAQLASNQLDPQAVADQLEQLASNLNQAVSGAQPQPTPPAPTPEPNPTPTPDPTPVPEPTPVDPNAPTT